MFGALNTVEPPIVEHEIATYFAREKTWRACESGTGPRAACNRRSDRGAGT
jgi:hypothetical protein